MGIKWHPRIWVAASFTFYSFWKIFFCYSNAAFSFGVSLFRHLLKYFLDIPIFGIDWFSYRQFGVGSVDSVFIKFRFCPFCLLPFTSFCISNYSFLSVPAINNVSSAQFSLLRAWPLIINPGRSSNSTISIVSVGRLHKDWDNHLSLLFRVGSAGIKSCFVRCHDPLVANLPVWIDFRNGTTFDKSLLNVK